MPKPNELRWWGPVVTAFGWVALTLLVLGIVRFVGLVTSQPKPPAQPLKAETVPPLYLARLRLDDLRPWSDNVPLIGHAVQSTKITVPGKAQRCSLQCIIKGATTLRSLLSEEDESLKLGQIASTLRLIEGVPSARLRVTSAKSWVVAGLFDIVLNCQPVSNLAVSISEFAKQYPAQIAKAGVSLRRNPELLDLASDLLEIAIIVWTEDLGVMLVKQPSHDDRSELKYDVTYSGLLEITDWPSGSPTSNQWLADICKVKALACAGIEFEIDQTPLQSVRLNFCGELNDLRRRRRTILCAARIPFPSSVVEGNTGAETFLFDLDSHTESPEYGALRAPKHLGRPSPKYRYIAPELISVTTAADVILQRILAELRQGSLIEAATHHALNRSMLSTVPKLEPGETLVATAEAYIHASVGCKVEGSEDLISLFREPASVRMAQRIETAIPTLVDIQIPYAALVVTNHQKDESKSHELRLRLTCKPIPYLWIDALHRLKPESAGSQRLRHSLLSVASGSIEVYFLLRTADDYIVLRTPKITRKDAVSEGAAASVLSPELCKLSPTWGGFVKVDDWTEHREDFDGLISSVVIKEALKLLGDSATNLTEHVSKRNALWSGAVQTPESFVLTYCVNLPIESKHVMPRSGEFDFWPMQLIPTELPDVRVFDFNLSDEWAKLSPGFELDWKARNIVECLRPL